VNRALAIEPNLIATYELRIKIYEALGNQKQAIADRKKIDALIRSGKGVGEGF
jgi:hypothetical protein